MTLMVLKSIDHGGIDSVSLGFICFLMVIYRLYVFDNASPFSFSEHHEEAHVSLSFIGDINLYHVIDVYQVSPLQLFCCKSL